MNTLRRRRHWLVAAAAALFLGGAAGALSTGVTSMMALSTLMVATTAWAYGWRPAVVAMLTAHAVGAGVMVRLGAGRDIPHVPPWAVLAPVIATESLVVLGMSTLRRLELARAAAEAEVRRANAELAAAAAEVRELRGLLPVCAWCKRVGDIDGLWDRVQNYLARHSQVLVSHGICPDCYAREMAGLGRAEDPPDPV